MVQEGFFNSLRNAPELIPVTIFMVIVVIKWMMMVREST